MTKTRTQALEELHDKILMIIIDSEIQIEYLKKQESKMIVMSKIEIKAGRQMRVDYTAEMLIRKEEGKLRENIDVLGIINRKIEEENSEAAVVPLEKNRNSAGSN